MGEASVGVDILSFLPRPSLDTAKRIAEQYPGIDVRIYAMSPFWNGEYVDIHRVTLSDKTYCVTFVLKLPYDDTELDAAASRACHELKEMANA